MKLPTTCVFLAAAAFLHVPAEEVPMKAENAVVITFPSQVQRTYKLLAAPNAGQQWAMVQDGIVGTGGEVTIFYKSQSDQKLFFKVETSEGPAGQRSLLSLANLDISNKDLSGYDLEGDDLRGYNFRRSKFDNANLMAANLSEANVGEASFVGADLRFATVQRLNLEVANLSQANLEGVRFVGAYAGFADFRNANLKGVQFDGTVLRGANFSGQTLTNFSLRAAGAKWHGLSTGEGLLEVNFSNANLAGADLSRNNADGINLTGANITDVNLEGSSLNGVSLNGRDLRTVFLRGVSVYSGNWNGVNASGNDLSLAMFGPEIALTNANFENANLEGVQIGRGLNPLGGRQVVQGVNFRGANLKGAFLEGINFQNCDFTGADLSFANVVSAQFPGCVGLDPEQPGMQFGNTILPDGTTRNGTNPGTGTAPASVPARLAFSITDGGTTNSVDLAFTGNSFSHGVGGTQQGTSEYEARGGVATLKLHYANPPSSRFYKLVFTSSTSGQLYGGAHGYHVIGTFTVPQ
jgi:uncharacterized protein YjbI with pentapeptide repeats